MASFDVAGALHAQRHGITGPDPITPASIGAANSDDPMLFDTGPRNVLGLLVNGWAAGSGGNTLILRRIGPLVSLDIYLNPADATAESFVVVPAGFRPSSASSMFVGAGLYEPGLANIGWLVDGTVRRVVSRSTLDSSRRIAGSVWWTTIDAVPTEPYPGTPA